MRNLDNPNNAKQALSESTEWQERIALIALAVLGIMVAFILISTLVDSITARQLNRANVDGIIDLTKSLVWPVILISIVSLFKSPLVDLIGRINSVNVKVAGNEITLDAAKQLAAASYNVALAKATSDVPTDGTSTADSLAILRQPGALVAGQSNDSQSGYSSLQRLAGRKIMWVDDRPQNNQYLIRAFEALGIVVETELSTDDAVAELSRLHYDLVITDMGRPPDPQAGYTLLRRFKESGIKIPTLVYAGSNSEEHRAMARAAGAVDSTNDPETVFNFVTVTLAGLRT